MKSYKGNTISVPTHLNGTFDSPNGPITTDAYSVLMVPRFIDDQEIPAAQQVKVNITAKVGTPLYADLKRISEYGLQTVAFEAQANTMVRSPLKRLPGQAQTGLPASDLYQFVGLETLAIDSHIEEYQPELLPKGETEAKGLSLIGYALTRMAQVGKALVGAATGS